MTVDPLREACDAIIANVFGRGNEPDPLFARLLNSVVDAAADPLRGAIAEERRLLRLSQEQHRDHNDVGSMHTWSAYTEARATVDALLTEAGEASDG